jgi:N-acetyl-gamma-glutamyl-phosphate reductase
VHKLPVGVLGASGYAGRELCALVEAHPSLELAFATAHGQRGQSVRVGARDITFLATEDAPLGDAALIFSAMPHGASLEWIARARKAGAKAVDLSSDLRPGHHTIDGENAPYGLTELMRAAVEGADLVANPGCYATAILLALAPLAREGLMAKDSAIVVNAASGVTGAGFTPKPELLFAEVSEDYRAYAVGNEHRHLTEMKAFLGALGMDNDVVFTPHLLPIARGILATIVVELEDNLTDVLAPWNETYGREYFIEVTAGTPSIRNVARTNSVHISATRAANTRRPSLIITAAIDNLTKGAAGQALQNANLMLGLEETLGLPR